MTGPAAHRSKKRAQVQLEMRILEDAQVMSQFLCDPMGGSPQFLFQEPHDTQKIKHVKLNKKQPKQPKNKSETSTKFYKIEFSKISRFISILHIEIKQILPTMGQLILVYTGLSSLFILLCKEDSSCWCLEEEIAVLFVLTAIDGGWPRRPKFLGKTPLRDRMGGNQTQITIQCGVNN